MARYRKYKIESMKGGKGKLFWHIHHSTLLEKAKLPIQRRVCYIKSDKPMREITARLACLKPVKRPDLLPIKIKKVVRSTWAIKWLVMECGTLNKKSNPELFTKVMSRHRKEYPKCNCNCDGSLNFKKPTKSIRIKVTEPKPTE